MIDVTSCPSCGGMGETRNGKCGRCHGKGEIQIEVCARCGVPEEEHCEGYAEELE